MTLLRAIVGRRKDAATNRGIRTAVSKWRQLARGETDVQEVKSLCTLVAASCYSAPDIAAIQTAYEREASAGSRLCKR